MFSLVINVFVHHVSAITNVKTCLKQLISIISIISVISIYYSIFHSKPGETNFGGCCLALVLF